MFSIIGLAALICAIVANNRINDLRRELTRVKRSADGGASEEVLDELERLRGELMDVHERLDFTERLLSSEQRKLPGGSGS